MIASVLQLSGRVAANLRSIRKWRGAEGTTGSKLPRLTRTYAVWWLLSLLAITTLISWRAEHKPFSSLLAGPLEDKLAYYHEHKSEFDLILLGDSLTYTGLHPEFIDPGLGTHSINMAAFAHWFATQYPFVQDLIPEIPHGTRVLWSVHLYDFEDRILVPRQYSVGLRNALLYWSWGAHNPGLVDNLLYYNPFTRFFFERDELRSRLIARGDNPISMPRLIPRAFAEPEIPAIPVFTGVEQRPLRSTAELRARLVDYYRRLPFVLGAAPISDRDQINSVVLYLKGGGYYRIELTPDYFRGKQQEMAKTEGRLDDKATEKFTPPPLGPVSLKMFEATLEAFRQAGIPVTINAMEEAPFTFPNEIVRRKYRELVDRTVEPIVRHFGDDYVHADYSSVVNADYFDYNHFNSTGIAKYTPLLIRELRKTPAFADLHER